MQTSKLIGSLVLAAASSPAAADFGDAHYRFFESIANAPSVAREQVRQELAAARASAEVQVGERGYAFAIEPSTRSRAEVVAEVLEAARLGVLVVGEAGAPTATAEQEARIAAAGREAAKMLANSVRKPSG